MCSSFIKQRHVSFSCVTFIWVFPFSPALSFSLPLAHSQHLYCPWWTFACLCHSQNTIELIEHCKFLSYCAVKPTPRSSLHHTIKPMPRVLSSPMVGTLHLFMDFLTCFWYISTSFTSKQIVNQRKTYMPFYSQREMLLYLL